MVEIWCFTIYWNKKLKRKYIKSPFLRCYSPLVSAKKRVRIWKNSAPKTHLPKSFTPLLLIQLLIWTGSCLLSVFFFFFADPSRSWRWLCVCVRVKISVISREKMSGNGWSFLFSFLFFCTFWGFPPGLRPGRWRLRGLIKHGPVSSVRKWMGKLERYEEEEEEQKLGNFRSVFSTIWHQLGRWKFLFSFFARALFLSLKVWD